MDDNAEQQLMEKIKHYQKTARNLKQKYESLLLKALVEALVKALVKQKSTDPTGDSDHSVKPPLANYANKKLMHIDFALESNQQQFKLALEQYLITQSALPTSADRPMIQSDDNKKQIAKVTINPQVKISNDNNGQIEAKLNPTVQALFTGTLPDDFFLHLMSVIGIQECLISNRLVCSFWNDLVLERCNNQKSLKLFETFDNLMDYGDFLLDYEKTEDTSLILKSIGDDLLFEGLETDHEKFVNSLNPEVILIQEKKREASKVLTTLFPRVEELVLCTELKTFINIEHLLQFYAGQLTSLTMTEFDPTMKHPGSKLRAFSFPKLKSLNTFQFSPEDDHLLSLLPQLESLTLPSSNISLETLLRTGTQLRELNIDYIPSVYTELVDEFSKRPRIYNNLRKFTFDSSGKELETLEFISLNLTSLECLKLCFCCRDKFPSLTSNLVPLQQLHSLTLETAVSFFLLDDNQLAQIQPLPSVRLLRLLLWNVASLPLKSMDLFSRSLFKAFSNVEQVLIAFADYDGPVDTAAFAAFEDFAGKHPTVVQLFRSQYLSMLTNLPNAVSPLLGHHRQMYEEYIEEVELFGVPICKLATYLVTRQGEDGPNLKSALRPADRLTAMSNLFQLMESGAFAFGKDSAMIWQMVRCAHEYGPSEVALFRVTWKCVLFLLDCRVAHVFDSQEKPFIYTEGVEVYHYLKMMLKQIEHYKTRQFDDKDLLLQICKRMVEYLTKFDKLPYDEDKLNECPLFNILLQLADHYQTQKLNVLENDEKLLLQIRHLMDNQLQKFSYDRLDAVISESIRSDNRVFRVEMVLALYRGFTSKDDGFK